MMKYAAIALLAAVLMTAAPDARAYCAPPCAEAGGQPAVQAATTGVQNLIQSITSGQLTIDHARTMAGEMEAMGNAVAAQQLRDAAAACETSGNCVTTPAATAAAAQAQAAVKQNLTTQSPLQTGDVGRQGAVFIAIIYEGSVFFRTSDGKFELYNQDQGAPAVFSGPLSRDDLTNSASSALTSDFLAQLPPRSQVVAGYGVGRDTKQAFDSMINNNSYKIVLTQK
jgi:hypothetical protein